MSKDDTGNGWVVSDEQWDTLSDEDKREKTFSLPESTSNTEDYGNSTVFEIPEPIETTVTQEDYEHFLMSQVRIMLVNLTVYSGVSLFFQYYGTAGGLLAFPLGILALWQLKRTWIFYSLILHAVNLCAQAVYAYVVSPSPFVPFVFAMQLLVAIMYAVTIYYTFEIWQMCPASEKLLEQCLGRQARNSKEFIIH